jgi:hypothetical protein
MWPEMRKSKDRYAPLILRAPQHGDGAGVPDVGDVERAASHEVLHGSGLATRNARQQPSVVSL